MSSAEWIAFAGWFGLVLYAVGWDWYALRYKKVATLSTGFRKASRQKITRWIVLPGFLLLACHLFFGWPV